MSRIQPMQDDGQSLPALHGHVIGFVDTREQVDAAVEKLVAAGFSQQEMALLAGEAGISLIKRVDRHYFADTEGSITSRSLAELRKAGSHWP